MDVVRVRAQLITGEVLIGPIMGNGGMMGSGSLHAGYAAASAQALRSLRVAKGRAKEGRGISIFEPSPGHVAIYPDFCGDGDGQRVEIPIITTIFTITLSLEHDEKIDANC